MITPMPYRYCSHRSDLGGASPALSASGLILAAVFQLAAWSSAWGNPPPPETDKRATEGCARCHYCLRPSSLDRCLREPCLRHARPKEEVDLGPDMVLLDELEREYMPVPFDHGGHARMAEMGQGCVACHHFSPPGERPPKCMACHDPGVEGTDPRKPGLKGAYHQQCLNCHREWTDERACEVCHCEKADVNGAVGASGYPTSDEVLKRMHPPIAPPDGELFRGLPDNGDGSVVFRHQQHVERFGLACVECHHEPSCTRCHTAAGETRKRTLVEHHRPCHLCHKKDMDLVGRSAGRCERCHWSRDRAMPQPFDHVSVGWSLGRFHEKVSCRSCHAEVPFARLDARCESCHKNWTPESFNHEITGLILDETHSSLACEQCHAHRRFDAPPTCADCHDKDADGIAFPARRPGRLVAPPPASTIGAQ